MFKDGYYAINKFNGDFFVGKSTQIAYTRVSDLKKAIKYWGKTTKDYDLFKLSSDGTTERMEW